MSDTTINPCTVEGSQCEDHFVTRKSMVAVAIVVLSLLGGCVAWAITINSAVAGQAITNVEQDKKLDALLTIDGKLNKILDNQEIIKARK